MSSRKSAYPPRYLVALIVVITIVPLAGLFWLGSRQLAQDRILEEQQAKERLQQSAGLVVARLQRALSTSLQQLAAGGVDWPEGALALTIHDDWLEAFPRNRIAYLPAVRSRNAPSTDVFDKGRELEHQKRDLAGAIDFFQRLAESPDPQVRAIALSDLGRTLSKSGQVEEALEAFQRLTTMDDVNIGGVPASLAGIYLRCDLLEKEKRVAELKTEARRLYRDLQKSRWQLIELDFSVYSQDVQRWLGETAAPHSPLVFEAAVAQLWRKRDSLTNSRPTILEMSTQTFVVLTQRAGESVRVLLATPEFVREQWLKPAEVVASEQKVSFKIGATDRDAPPASIKLKAAETELPWDVTTLDLSTSDPAFLSRQRLLVAAFTLLMFMTLAASYLIYRALRREFAAIQLQSDFVAAVSHEFRTPLTSLRQFTAMLRENPGLTEDRKVLCYDAQMRATDRLLSLVESVLDFGRMEAGARRYEFETRDCGEVVRRTIEEFRTNPQAANYDIEFHQDATVQADTDVEALSRAVRNLLENAVKYSPHEHSIRVALERSNGHVRIAVQDHGIGIPAEEQTQIFRKFQRGEQARTLGIKGTGIGLAMVDEIVRAHQGRVELESKPGAGSTFTIVLPAKD